MLHAALHMELSAVGGLPPGRQVPAQSFVAAFGSHALPIGFEPD
jgi:hypothetical protein